MTDIVNGFMLRGGQVLMAKRSADRATYSGTWSVPGGHVEPGETPRDALVRELHEEVGVTVLQSAPRGVFGHDGVRFHMFAVSDWIGTPQMHGNEHSALEWFPIRDALTLAPMALSSYSSVLLSLEAHAQ